MLNSIVDLSLRHKVLVLVAFVLVVFFGVRAWQHIPIDSLPDVTPVQVSIQTEAPGLASEEVEKLLTMPVETAMAGLPGVEHIRSLSMFGFSQVTVYFKDNVDIYFARRLVSEKLLEAKAQIPEGYGEPRLGANASSLGQAFWYAVESADKKLTGMELRTMQDWNVRLILRTAPGVDNVISWGGHEKQYQVLINPQRLIKYGLTFKEVMGALAVNNRQVGGQYVNLGQEQHLVRGLGLVANAQEIGGIVITERAGIPIYVRDVAEVKEAPALRFGAITKDGEETTLGMVLARTGENAQNVVDAVKEKLEVIKQSLPSGVTIQAVYDRTELIGKVIVTADRAMIEGAILVISVLFLFLGEVRSAIIVVIAIPMTRLIAFIFMDTYGVPANLMSLGGLIVGLGMTIDGPLVLMENTYRRLSHHVGKTVNRTQVVLEAAREVMNPIAFGVLIIIVVFLPLFALTGLEGKMFKPLAINMVFAMIGSLILTLTLIPVLAAIGLRAKQEKEPTLVRWLKARYTPILLWSLERRKTVITGAVSLFVLAMGLFPFLGKEFMPTLQEGSFVFRVVSIPSTSLEQTISVSKQAEKLLLMFPQTQTALSLIGRAERGDEIMDVSKFEVFVALKPHEIWPEKIDYTELSRAMQERLAKAFPSAVIGATQPIQMRVEELISGVRKPWRWSCMGAISTPWNGCPKVSKRCWKPCPGCMTFLWKPTRASHRS